MKIVIRPNSLILLALSICIFSIGLMISWEIIRLEGINDYRSFIVLMYFGVIICVCGYLKKNLLQKDYFFKRAIRLINMARTGYFLSCLFATWICSQYPYMAQVFILIIVFIMADRINFTDSDLRIIASGLIIVAGIYFFFFGMITMNSQGIILAECYILVINIYDTKKKSEASIFIKGLITGIFLILISMTGSRASMVCLLFLFFIHCVFFSNIKQHTVSGVLSKLILIVGLLVVAFVSNSFFSNFFFHKWNNIDLTSGRIAIWERIFSEASIWGNDLLFISLIKNDAHNSWIQAMGIFGICASVFFSIWIICILVEVIRNRDVSRITFFVGWIILSLFENLEPFSSRMLPLTIMFIIYLPKKEYCRDTQNCIK